MPKSARKKSKSKSQKLQKGKIKLFWISVIVLVIVLPITVLVQQKKSELETHASTTSPISNVVTFEDDFNGAAGAKPDAAKWTYNTGLWPNELETYTTNAENAQTDGLGNLVFTAMKDGKGGYSSARIHTANSFSQAYGRVEARMKMPPGQGLLPAFWMLGANYNTVPWPDCGEIDILEEPGDGAIHMTLHGHGDTSGYGLSGQYNGLDVTGWHVYGVNWTPFDVTWTIDGTPVRTVTKTQAGTMWSFDNPEIIILNLAVGGLAGTPPAGTQFPAKMYVDYVKAYAYSPTVSAAPTTNTPSPTVPIPTPTPTIPTTATQPTNIPSAVVNGLTGSYFSNPTLSGAPTLVRVDPAVNFNWSFAAPGPSLPADNFSVRWTGYIIPKYSQQYTFYTQSDDGIRLWVNNTRIINNWVAHASTQNTGKISLKAGRKYPIKIEFYDAAEEAVAQLFWSSQSQSKQIIPPSQLLSK